MTLVEWDKNVAEMTDKELIARYEAIETLAKWRAFNKEFSWTSFKTLAITIWYELDRRKNAFCDSHHFSEWISR
jgi:hypothetical protein